MSDFEKLMAMATAKQSEKNGQKKISLNKKKTTDADSKLAQKAREMLEKKKAEERKKRIEEKLKKDRLLELRANDKKSSRAMKSMLKMTKSSNKSALDEATNANDTSATLAGRHQCDEDDYGYESEMARGFYEKLMSKYEANPGEDPMDKFTKSGNKRKMTPAELLRTAARVKNSLQNPEDDNVIRKSSVSSSTSSSKSSSSKESSSSSSKSSSKSSFKAPASPPPKEDEKKKLSSRKQMEEEARRKRMERNAKIAKAQKEAGGASYTDLMTMAFQKSKNPLSMNLDGTISTPEKGKKANVVKEAEFGRPMTKKEKEEFLRERNSQLRKMGKLPPAKESKDDGKSSSNNNNKSVQNGKSRNEGQNSKSSNDKKAKSPPPPPPPKKPVITGPEFHPAVVKKKPQPVSSSSHSNGKKDSRKSDMSSSRSSSSHNQSRKRERSRSRSRSPDMYRSKSSKSYNRIDSDDEDEYDSELDDFIDDSDAKIDISSEIRSIFGYDRRKFRYEEDFDDRSMENNRYSDVMKEEARSARIGRQEDEEEERKEREEEERRRRKMKSKNRR